MNRTNKQKALIKIASYNSRFEKSIKAIKEIKKESPHNKRK